MNAVLELLHRHRAVALPIAAVVCLFAGLFIVWQFATTFSRPASPPRISQAYFYDLNTSTLFLAPADSDVPLTTDSGEYQGHPAGVRAVVFSCGSCNDEQQRFVGWLEMPDPEFDQPILDSDNGGEDEPSGMLIRRPTGDQWHSLDSAEAEVIMREAQATCNSGGTLRPCHPPSAVAD